VRIVNECGDVSVRLGRPATLLVPARASEAGPVAAPLESEHDLDHLLCRAVKAMRGEGQDGGTSLPNGAQIEIADAFQARLYDLVELTGVCVPVAKSGSPSWRRGPREGEPVGLVPASVRHPERGYACYRVKLARRMLAQGGCGPADPGDEGSAIRPAQPRHAHRSPRRRSARLGRVPDRRELEVCLPSQAVVVAAP
jgi:hypothetical protein